MPDRLAADLRRFFGVRLSDVWVGKEDVLEVADYAANLPRGGAVGEWYGGGMAITAEVEAMWEANYLLAVAVAEKPKKVKPRKMPEGIRTVEARAAREAKASADKARALKAMGRLYGG